MRRVVVILALLTAGVASGCVGWTHYNDQPNRHDCDHGHDGNERIGDEWYVNDQFSGSQLTNFTRQVSPQPPEGKRSRLVKFLDGRSCYGLHLRWRNLRWRRFV